MILEKHKNKKIVYENKIPIIEDDQGSLAEV